MSTFILGRLTVPRNRSARAADDQKGHWLEALAAVIPGEALAAYTAIISFFTVKGSDGADASLSNPGWVKGLSLTVMLAIPIVYGSASGHILGGRHVLRWAVAMVAFAAWLWLLPLSVWDTITDLDANIRAGVGIAGALVIVSAASFLFKKWPVV